MPDHQHIWVLERTCDWYVCDGCEQRLSLEMYVALGYRSRGAFAQLAAETITILAELWQQQRLIDAWGLEDR